MLGPFILYTHFCYVTMHFLCIKNTYISPIHRADLQDMSYPWLPLWELMLCLNLGEGGGRDKLWQGFYFLLTGTRKLTFSLVWIEHFKLINISTLSFPWTYLLFSPSFSTILFEDPDYSYLEKLKNGYQ